jgi:hypothetical protein
VLIKDILTGSWRTVVVDATACTKVKDHEERRSRRRTRRIQRSKNTEDEME